MSDWICRDCGNIADEGELTIVTERHDELDDKFCEHFFICPCCGSDAVEEAASCDHCGGSFLEDSLHGGYYCDECMESFLGTAYAVGFCEENYEEFAEYVHEKEECECSSARGT